MLRPFVFSTALLLAASALTARGAVIEGVVTEQATGRPLARARVSVVAIQGASRVTPPIFTDSNGHFSLTQLAAGAYLLGADRGGYVLARYGQKRWNGAGAPIIVGPDDRVAIELRLMRLGAISGEIVDENGVGLAGIPVVVYRDTKPLRQVGQGATDDRGVFRVAGLEPGRYRVRTGPKELEDGTNLLPTFLGDAVAPENSSTVDAVLDEETSGVRIRPVSGKLARLSGRVTFPGVDSVVLYSDLGRVLTGVDNSGRFSFSDVSPGGYELIAESSLGGASQVGYTRVWVSSDMDEINLDPMPAPVMQVRCQDTQGQASNDRELSLFVRRTGPSEDPRSQRLACGVKATLSVGTWVLSVWSPPTLSLAQVQVQREPIPSNELSLQPGQALEATLVVSSRPAGLKGTVTGPNRQPVVGAMVFLRALDAAVARRLYGKGVGRTDQSGDYVIQGLPPGTYEALVSLDFQTADEVVWEGQDLVTVELEEGREITLDLTM